MGGNILFEFVGFLLNFVLNKINMKLDSISIFCGSKLGNNPQWIVEINNLVKFLVNQNIEIVYGGGNTGIMGVVADVCLKNKGTIIGVIPNFLSEKEVLNTQLSKTIITNTMHERKKILFEMADSALILPGGCGTLDELFEMSVWNTLEIHKKKIYVMNYDHFYDHLIAQIETMYKNGFLYQNPTNIWEICKTNEAFIQSFLTK